jgi:hypothetical protein
MGLFGVKSLKILVFFVIYDCLQQFFSNSGILTTDDKTGWVPGTRVSSND